MTNLACVCFIGHWRTKGDCWQGLACSDFICVTDTKITEFLWQKNYNYISACFVEKTHLIKREHCCENNSIHVSLWGFAGFICSLILIRYADLLWMEKKKRKRKTNTLRWYIIVRFLNYVYIWIFAKSPRGMSERVNKRYLITTKMLNKSSSIAKCNGFAAFSKRCNGMQFLVCSEK